MSTNAAMTHLEISGELTIFTAAELRQQLLEALGAGLDVEVDLSRVGEIDSAGLQLMLAAKQEAAGRKRALHFTGHSAAVCDALELCKLFGQLGDPVLVHSPS
ncbi:MAG: STAS domain-containing protein [Azoarcus sp.]|nr:STAS domain-containing protein [Azoarcus sp.]